MAFSRLRREAEKERKKREQQTNRGQVVGAPVSPKSRLLQEAAKERGTDAETLLKSRLVRSAVGQTTNAPTWVRERAIELAMQMGTDRTPATTNHAAQNSGKTENKLPNASAIKGHGGRSGAGIRRFTGDREAVQPEEFAGGITAPKDTTVPQTIEEIRAELERAKSEFDAANQALTRMETESFDPHYMDTAEYAALSREYGRTWQRYTELQKALELEEYASRVKDDTFLGQFGANFDVGQLTEMANAAYNEYATAPTEANRAYAERLDRLMDQYVANNAAALDDEGAVLPWITKSAAGYLPQLGNQLKAGLGGAAAGAGAGAIAGSVVPGLGTGAAALWGARAGYVGGTGVYSYNNMRGAAFRELLKLGVDEETARAAAGDEAVVSALIEMVDAGIDLATLGTAKIASTPVRKAIKALAGYGINIGGEALEEGLQQSVSIANRERDGTGKMNLVGGAVSTLWDAVRGEDDAARAEILEAAEEGAKIAAMFGGAANTVNSAIDTHTAKTAGTEIRSAGSDAVQMLIESGLESGKNTESYRIASDLKAKLDSGKKISDVEIGWLQKANTEAIEAEQRGERRNQLLRRFTNAAVKTDEKTESEVDPIMELARETVAAREKAAQSAPMTLEELARETVAERERAAQARTGAATAGNSNVPYNAMSADNSARQTYQSQQAAIKKWTGYGDNGVKTFAEVLEQSGADPRAVRKSFQTAYESGLTGIDRKRVELITPLQEQAFIAGSLDYIASQAKDKTRTTVTAGAKSGFDATGAPSHVTKTQIRIIDDLAKALGSPVIMGDIKGNGEINSRGGVTLSTTFQTKIGDKDVSIVYHGVHELGMHRLMQLAPTEGRAFMNAMYNYLSKGRPNTVETLAESKQRSYAAQDVSLTTDAAVEEVVANNILPIYESEDALGEAIRRIANGSDQQAKRGLKKFREILGDIVKKLRDIAAKLTGKEKTEAQQALSEVERLREMYENALTAAVKKNRELMAEKTATRESEGEYLTTASGVKYSLKMSFEEQVEAALNGELDRNTAVFVMNTPEMLQALGLKEYPMLITQRHIRDINHAKSPSNSHWHGLSEDIIKKLPDMIANPVMLLESTTAGDVVAVSSVLDGDGLPVIVSIHPDGSGQYNRAEIASNFVTSMYGKKSFAAFVNSAINDDRVLYVNKKRIRSLYSRVRLQLPKSLDRDGFIKDSIARQEDDVNSVDGAQFSLKEQNDLLKENAKLKEVNEALREQFKLTTFAQVDEKNLDKFAKTLLKDYRSGADINEIRDALSDVYNYMANGEDGQSAAWNDLQQRAYDVAISILESASTVNDEMYQSYKSLCDRLRNYPISIDKRYNNDIQGYESINAFRRANFGRLKITKDGTPVDIVYSDLANTYPEFFDENEYTTQADQITHIADVLDSLQPYEFNPYSSNMRQAATWLASDIIERFYELPQAKPTFADKQSAKLTKQVIKDAKKLEILRDKKNERIKELIQKNREKVKATTQKERGKRAEAVKKVKDHYKEKERKASESRKARELRAKIMRHAQEMSKKLLRPTDKQHVPQELRGTVVELLESINMESQYTYDPDTYHEVKRKDGKSGGFTGKHLSDGSGLPTKRTEKFENLRKQLKEIKDRGGNGMVFDPSLLGSDEDGIPSKFDAVTAMKDTPLDAMNSEQLTTIWEVLRAVEFAISSAGKTLSKNKYGYTVDWALAFEEDTATRRIKRSRSKEHYTLDIETPYTFFSHYGQAGLDLYRMLRNAQDQQQVMQDEIAAKIKKIASSELRDKMENKSATFTTDRGDKLVLSKAHVMEMYLLSKRKQAYNHLKHGGIVQPEVGKTRRGNGVILLTETDIASIIGSLTAEEKALADKYRELTDLLAKWGNEASMKAYGYEKFSDPDYWPISSASEHIQHTVERNATKKARSIANMGSAKPLIPGATNTLDLPGIFATFDNHASDMMDYAAWLLPMEDVNRLFNFRFRNKDGQVVKTMQDILNDYGGEKSINYWKNLMTDIQNGVNLPNDTSIEGLVSKVVGNTKRAAVAANLRVVIQQPTAFARAAAVLDPDLMLLNASKGVTVKSMVDGWEKAKKYAPIAARKAAGGFEIASNPKRLAEIFYKPETVIGKTVAGVKDAGMFLPGVADAATWGVLWNTCESQIKRYNKDVKPGTDEFYTAVKELFTEVIDQTQVVDGVLQRSQAMRSSSSLMKQMTSFTGEPTQAGNMVIRAYDKVRYETDKKKRGKAIKTLSRSIAAYVVTAALNAFAQSLADALRDDDDEKEYWAKVWKFFSGISGDEKTWLDFAQNILLASNAVNNLNPLTWLPVAKDVLSLIQGYSVQRMDAAAMEDLINSIVMTIKTIGGDGKLTTGYAALKTTLLAWKLAGGGGYNFLRDLEGVVRTFQVETDDFMALYETEKLMTKPKNNKKAYTDMLYLAYKTDKDAFDELYARMLKDDELKTDDKTTSDYIAGALKPKLIDELFALYKSDYAAYKEMSDDLIERDFLKTGVKTNDPETDTFVSTSEAIAAAMEERLKEDQGAKSVEDLESRFMLPDQQSEYDSKMRIIQRSSAWKNATEKQRDKLEDRLYNIVSETKSGLEMLETIEEGASFGLDETEYLLYKLALEMVDQPNENGNYGTYTSAERAAAFSSAGLGDGEIAYLWGTEEALDAFGFGIDMNKYIAFKANVGSFTADAEGSKRKKVERYLYSVCDNEKEFLFLLGTVYDSVRKDADYKMYFGG